MWVSAKEMGEALKAAPSVDIICHRSPDGDTLGSAVGLYWALQELDIPARIQCSDAFSRNHQFIVPEEYSLKERGQVVVAVDIATRKLLGNLEEEYPHIDLCIDHHPTNEDFADKTYLVGTAVAAAEVVAEVIEEMGIALTPNIAMGLYTGISSDSVSFRYHNTSPSTLRLGAKLLEGGADKDLINEWLFESKSPGLIKAEALAILSLKYDGPIAVMLLPQSLMEECGISYDELDGLAAIPRTIAGIEIAITVKETPTENRISIRTTDPYDATKIVSPYGGGGHIRAAGCRMSGPTLEEIGELMVMEAKKQL